MAQNQKDKTFVEKLYKQHVLPFGSLGKIDIIDMAIYQLENPLHDYKKEAE